MSVDKQLIGENVQSGYRDDGVDAAEPLGVDEYRGLLGRLKSHFETWPQRYVDLRIEARTGRSR